MTSTPETPAPAAPAEQPAPFKMGSIGKHSIVYAIGILLTKAIAFIMLPIYTRYLTPSDYGILQLVTMTLEVISIIAGSRIAYGIFHFYHKAATEEEKRGVLSTAILLLMGTYGGATIIAGVASPWISQVVFGEAGPYVTYLRLACASFAFESLILVPTALFQLREDSTKFVLVSLVRLVLQVVLNLILLVPFKMGVAGVLISSVVSNGVVGAVLAVHMLVSIGARFQTSSAKEFLRFGIPLVGMQIATFVYTFGDRYFLNRAGNEAVVGLYGLAYQFGFLVGTVSFMPFQLIWEPKRFAIAKRPDRDQIFSRAFIYLNIVLVSSALGISLFVGDVLRVIATPAFHTAAAFVPLLVAAYVFHAWGQFHNFGIYITEKTEYFTAANWVAAVVAVAGYVFLVPPLLAWGASLATFASLGVRFWLSYRFSQRLYPVRYDWVPVVRIVILASAVGTMAALIPPLGLAPSLLAHTALFAVYAAALWHLPVLTAADRGAVRAMVRGLPRRLGLGVAEAS